MESVRWIDAKLGVVEVTLIGSRQRYNFKTMEVETSNVVWGSNRGVHPLRYDEPSAAFECLNPSGYWSHPLSPGEISNKLNQFFSQWLNRVMLDDDADTASKDERGAILASVEAAEAAERDSDVLDKRPDFSSDDNNVGRVPLRSSERHFPVVPGERSWKIRPR